MSTKAYLMGEGAIWIQPDGPNTPAYYLGCHTLGDLEAPEGGTTLLYCQDPGAMNKWRAVNAFQDPPELVTTSIETPVGKVADWLEKVACPFGLFVHKSACGRPDDFSNYDRTWLLTNARRTGRTYTGMRSRNENGESLVNVPLESLPPLVLGFRLTVKRQPVDATVALNDVTVCGEGQCASDCGPALTVGDVAVAVGDAAYAAAAFARRTENAGGDGWPATALAPFAVGEVIASAVCFQVDRSTTRILVARGTTDVANPAEVAYSDDDGATWTLVDVGSTNGQFANDSGALFALDKNRIWFATTGGYIYFSSDGGLTWAAQESGGVTVGAYNAVYFMDERKGMAVAAGDVVAVTEDGGDSWSVGSSTLSGDALTTVGHNGDGNFWWVGTASGELYYSEDDGVTWTARAFTGSGAGDVADLKFLNTHFGAMLHNLGGGGQGYVHITIDGGNSWERLSTPANLGLNALVVVGTDLIYAVGEVQAGTAVVLKLTPDV